MCMCSCPCHMGSPMALGAMNDSIRPPEMPLFLTFSIHVGAGTHVMAQRRQEADRTKRRGKRMRAAPISRAVRNLRSAKNNSFGENPFMFFSRAWGRAIGKLLMARGFFEIVEIDCRHHRRIHCRMAAREGTRPTGSTIIEFAVVAERSREKRWDPIAGGDGRPVWFSMREQQQHSQFASPSGKKVKQLGKKKKKPVNDFRRLRMPAAGC